MSREVNPQGVRSIQYRLRSTVHSFIVLYNILISYRGSGGGGGGGGGVGTEMFNVLQEMEDFPFFPLSHLLDDR